MALNWCETGYTVKGKVIHKTHGHTAWRYVHFRPSVKHQFALEDTDTELVHRWYLEADYRLKDSVRISYPPRLCWGGRGRVLGIDSNHF